MSSEQNIDWRVVEEALTNLTAWLGPIELATAEDCERFHLSLLTYGQIKSALPEKIAFGYALLIKGESDDAFRKEVFQTVAWQLGLSDKKPEAVPSYLSGPSRQIDTVHAAIANQTVTTDFLLA